MNIEISKEKLQKAFDGVAGLAWKPAKPEDYQTLADLAAMMTGCKQPGIPPDLGAMADQFFEKIKQVSWTDDHAKAINQQAAGQLAAAGHGAVFVGTLKAKANDQSGKPTALLFEASGVKDILLVPAAGDALKAAAGSKWLVLGIILPQTGQAKGPGQSEPQTVRFILSRYMLPMKK